MKSSIPSEPKLKGFPLITVKGRFSLKKYFSHPDHTGLGYTDCPVCMEYERLCESDQWPSVSEFLLAIT